MATGQRQVDIYHTSCIHLSHDVHSLNLTLNPDPINPTHLVSSDPCITSLPMIGDVNSTHGRRHHGSDYHHHTSRVWNMQGHHNTQLVVHPQPIHQVPNWQLSTFTILPALWVISHLSLVYWMWTSVLLPCSSWEKQAVAEEIVYKWIPVITIDIIFNSSSQDSLVHSALFPVEGGILMAFR